MLYVRKAESYRGANTNTQSTFFDDTLEFTNLIVDAHEHVNFEFYGARDSIAGPRLMATRTRTRKFSILRWPT